MATKQQNEALLYFREHAEDWRNKAILAGQKKVNVIQQRNNYVLHVIKNRTTTQSALDVGCGTGDLVCDIARTGIDSTGVDFADEMISIARARAQQDGLEKAHFYCCSIFDFDLSERRYDTISANGFIEYISIEELDRFLELSYQALNLGGSLVVGSRNRLFNVVSLNAFTQNELDDGTISLLLKEAIAIASETNLEKLIEMETAPLQKANIEHLHTGINVSTRYQYSPVQLMRMFMAKGFTIKQIYPIHIHGVPPTFKDRNPEVHTSISNLLQNYADEHMSLVPYSSSFMVHAQKV